MIKRFSGARKESVSSFLMSNVLRMSQTGRNNYTAFKHKPSRYSIQVGQNVIRWTFFILNTSKVSLSKDVHVAYFSTYFSTFTFQKY